jgi:cadmium resistance protein CadD (predicted permease)
MAIEMLALLIPIITIVLGVAIAIVWIVTAHRQKVQRADMRHKERMAAIDKGLELPPDPVEPEAGRRPGGLRSGVAGLLVGVVLYLALRAVADEDVALFGLIPAALGIANLVSYFIEQKGTGNGRELKRDA